MSFVKIMVHCVWVTKNRAPVLIKEKRLQLIEFIRDNAKEKKIFIDCINGHNEHLHALISLGRSQNIADVMQQIKGGSSFWANNKTNLFVEKLAWADKYFAISVSESQLNKVRNYIRSQEAHHQKTTFQQEYEALIRKHGFQDLG